MSDSETMSTPSNYTVLTFGYEQFYFYAHDVQNALVTLVLLGVLYGILTVLAAISVHALTRRSTKRTRRAIIILCLTILTLWTSTTVDMVAFIISTQSTLLGFLVDAGDKLWTRASGAFCLLVFEGPGPGTVVNDLPLQNCASTIALTLNITLGDAIVCWRACVIWNNNRGVRAVCVVFLLATLVLGALDTVQGCQSVVLNGPIFSRFPTHIGVLYEGAPVGIAACVMSLSTNLFATVLVAYKAWQHRRRLRGYLLAGSQVEKLFALLIESGAAYCAMWVVIVAFQIAEYEWEISPYQFNVKGLASSAGLSFLNAISVVCSGVLVPVIAIYPMTIIVLVALDRSHIEKGLSQHLESVPTPRLAQTVLVVTGESENRRRPEGLVISISGLGGADGTEEVTTCVDKEGKLEAIS